MECPICKEKIKDSAGKCIYCGTIIDSDTGLPVNNERYRELYLLGEKLTQEKQDSAYKKDDKANKYMILLTLIFGIVSFFMKWYFDDFIKFDIFSYFIIGLFVICIFCIAATIYQLIDALKFLYIKKMLFDNNMKEMFLDDRNRPIDYYNELIENIIKEYNETTEQINIKDTRLNKAHGLMKLTLICSEILIILALISIFINLQLKYAEGGQTTWQTTTIQTKTLTQPKITGTQSR